MVPAMWDPITLANILPVGPCQFFKIHSTPHINEKISRRATNTIKLGLQVLPQAFLTNCCLMRSLSQHTSDLNHIISFSHLIIFCYLLHFILYIQNVCSLLFLKSTSYFLLKYLLQNTYHHAFHFLPYVSPYKIIS